MSSDPIAVRVTDLHKSYRLGLADLHLREVIMRRAHHPLRARQVERFAALQGVSFEVPAGQVLGIVGRNGAGKSTLLKIISRITHPDRGTVDIWGRVGSLIEVGTGFHPELTGRENVFLNGSILGMRRREIAAKYDAIVDFAGIAQFMDTPVKRYSSGMVVRLAFSVAAHLDSEIVIIDEVLAVGDAEFQAKCVKKIESITQDEGRTALFVSHNLMPIRRVCQRVVVLEHGKVIFDGETEQALARYLRDLATEPEQDEETFVVVTDDRGTKATMLPNGAPAQVKLRAAGEELEQGAVVVSIVSEGGELLAQFASDGPMIRPGRGAPERTVVLSIPALDLPTGRHRVHGATRLGLGRLVELGSTLLEVADGVDLATDQPAPWFRVEPSPSVASESRA